METSPSNHGTKPGNQKTVQATRTLHQATMEQSPGKQKVNLGNQEPSPGNEKMSPGHQEPSAYNHGTNSSTQET